MDSVILTDKYEKVIYPHRTIGPDFELRPGGLLSVIIREPERDLTFDERSIDQRTRYQRACVSIDQQVTGTPLLNRGRPFTPGALEAPGSSWAIDKLKGTAEVPTLLADLETKLRQRVG